MEKTTFLIKPLFDRVLLEREAEQQTASGIILPREQSDKAHIMRVVAVGDVGAVRVGDRVVVAKYAGTDVNVGGFRGVLVCEQDILGVING